MTAAAEVQKLARTLGVDVDRLGVVDGLPAEDLRILRGQIGEALFQADRHHFTRVAALAKTVPGAVTAKITEVALPPFIAARTAELLEPDRAADMVSRISPRYLADVSTNMEPARAPQLIASIPPALVAAVTQELRGRGEWVVMGGFVSHVDTPALQAAVAVLDGEALVRIGYVLDEPSRLDAIDRLLTESQSDGMLVAAAEHGLWAELAAVVDGLADDRVAYLAARYAAAPADVRTAFEAAAAGGDPAAGLTAALSA